MGQIRYADQVREHTRHEYIEPARRRGDSTAKIVAGDVQMGEPPLLRLWGIGKDAFQRLGGGVAFIRSEREQWGR